MAATLGTLLEQTYRVDIDLARIQANVLAFEGSQLSEWAIRNWLRSVGFTPDPDGRTWLAGGDCLGRLHPTEILDLTPVGPAA